MAARTILLNIIGNDRVSRTFRNVGNELRNASDETSKLSKAMGGLNKVGKVASLATAAGGALALAKAATPAAAAVAALPAAMIATKVATGTLKVGLYGVGDAMSAVAEGDAKQLDEALKKLAPNAAAFVKQAASMKKEVTGLQQSVQQRLFAGLGTDLKSLGATYLPVARTGMGQVATALNGIAREAARTVANPWFSGKVSQIFSGTASVLNTLKGAVQPLLESVVQLGVAGLPLVQRMAGWAVQGARAAAAFLQSERGSRALTGVVQQAGDRLAQLGRIGRNVADAILHIVGASGAFNTTGGDVLRTVEQLTGRFAAWTRSAEGQRQTAQIFQMLGQTAQQVAGILPLVLGPLGAMAKVLVSLPQPVRGVVSQMLAWSIVIGVVAKNLRILSAVTIAYKTVAAGSQFIGGLMNVNRAQAEGATRATRLGAAVRGALAATKAWIVAQFSAARAALTSALASARQAVSTVATTVAQKAAAVASKAWAAAQWLLNAAMSANPIGLVVLAIVGLVAAFVLAYKKVGWFRTAVDAVFGFLKTAVTTVISFVRDHWKLIVPLLFGPLAIVVGLVIRYWSQIKNAVMAAVNFVVGFVRDHWRLILVFVLGPLGLAIGLVTKYWSQISGAVMSAVNFAVGFVRDHWRLIIAFILGPLGIVIGLVTKYWGQIRAATSAVLSAIVGAVRAGWNAVRAAFSAALNAIIGFVTSRWNTLKAITSALVSALLSRLRAGLASIRSAVSSGINAVVGVFTGGWNRLKSITSSLASALHSRISSLMGSLRSAFSTGVSAIGKAWDRLRSVAKAPVNFMIGTVYNKGIVGLWNKVMGWLHIGGMELHGLPLLARGGTLANPAAAAPMMTNGPMAIVGEGRARYPEYVIPTDPRYRGRAQALWAAAGAQMQMLAKGGIIGDVLGGIKKAAGKVVGLGKDALALITDPGKVWDKLAAPVLGLAGGIGGSPWADAIRAIPAKLMGTIKGAALAIFKAFNAGFGGDASGVVKAAAKYIGVGDDRGRDNDNMFTRMWGWPAGTPWCALFASTAIKDAKAGKKYPGYPTAAVATFNARMRHVPVGEGRPGDLATYRGDGHVNIIEKALGGGVYQTIGGNEGPVVRRGQRGGATAMLRPLARGGLLSASGRDLGVFGERNFDQRDRRDQALRMWQGVFDSGGMLMPGWNLAYNGLGRPEPVFPTTEAAAAYGGGGREVHVHFDPGSIVVNEKADVDMLMAALEFRLRSGAL